MIFMDFHEQKGKKNAPTFLFKTTAKSQQTTVGRPVHARPTWFFTFAESDLCLAEQEVSVLLRKGCLRMPT